MMMMEMMTRWRRKSSEMLEWEHTNSGEERGEEKSIDASDAGELAAFISYCQVGREDKSCGGRSRGILILILIHRRSLIVSSHLLIPTTLLVLPSIDR
eukprot:457430-Hanusia_phi.AAC.1